MAEGTAGAQAPSWMCAQHVGGTEGRLVWLERSEWDGGCWGEEVAGQWELDLAGPGRLFFAVRWKSPEALSIGEK